MPTVATNVKPGDIAKAIETIKSLVKFGKGLAALTPTKADDAALASVDGLVAILEPVITQPWFPELLNTLFGLVNKNEDVKALLDKLKEAQK